MDKVTLTVFFDNPFWVGVFERVEGGKLSACKVTFGKGRRGIGICPAQLLVSPVQPGG